MADPRVGAFKRLGVGRMGGIDVPGWQRIIAQASEKQRPFVVDRRQGAAARAGRGAGKSYGVAMRKHRLSAAHPNQASLFITLSSERSRDILLPALYDLDKRFKIGIRERKKDNCALWPNGYRVLFRGCKDRIEANKRRGTPWVSAHWDECDTIPSALLEYDIHECVEPRLVDFNGTWSVSGTPGPIPQGYWHKLSTGPNVHTWDARDNPFIRNVLKYWTGVLDRMGATRGLSKSKWPAGITSIEQILAKEELWGLLPPSFVREYLGQWVADLEALIYQVTQANTYVGAIPHPDLTTIGIDLGGATKEKPDLDRCAVTVAQSCRNSPLIWVPEAFSKSDATVQSLAAMVMQLLERYPDASVFLDSASAGTIILHTFQKMGIPINPAEKRMRGPKQRRIQLVQGALRSGDLQISRMWNKERQAPACQDLLEEATALVWSENRRDHHPKCKDDVWDSALYAIVPHLGDYDAEYEPPKPGSREAEEAENEREFEEALREAEGMEDCLWLPLAA